jgi:hypothetical protein
VDLLLTETHVSFLKKSESKVGHFFVGAAAAAAAA